MVAMSTDNKDQIRKEDIIDFPHDNPKAVLYPTKKWLYVCEREYFQTPSGAHSENRVTLGKVWQGKFYTLDEFKRLFKRDGSPRVYPSKRKYNKRNKLDTTMDQSSLGNNTLNSDGQNIVIKLGTSTLTQGTNELNRAHMLEIVRVVAKMREQGHRVTLVSSGAMAAGREVVKHYATLPSVLSSKQLLASVGQGYLIEVWSNLFAIYGIHIGQLLLTRADLENRERFLNARDTLFALLDNGIVPVINENDALSTAEIKVGDNDTLGAITACAIEADKLILLTDQKGLYDADPRTNPEAKLIRQVDKIDESIIKLAGGSGTNLGTGGMSTKVKAAKIATQGGVEVIIASGKDPSIMLDLINEQGEGTFFKTANKSTELRKIWLSSTTKPAGKLIVDDGAAKALCERGSSLLPSGIVKVSGEFLRGAVIEIDDLNGKSLAKGIVRYTAQECEQIRGCKSDEIENKLGFSHGVVIHRNDLVLI